MNMSELVQSSQWKKFMAKLYGWGASLVILGALFKLMHWPMASTMLIIGMSTETIIFFFSAFEPIHEDVDWTLVYPELAGISEDEDFGQEKVKEKDHGRSSGGGFGKLDEMLENAEITPELFDKLGKGLKNLNQTTQNLIHVSDAAKATNQFVEHLQTASESVSSMAESYNITSQQLNGSVNGFLENFKTIEDKIQANISNIANGNQSYNDKLELLNKNLSALNSVYELQLQNTSEQVNNSKVLTGEMDQIMNNLKGSAEETKVYKEEISRLNKNLSALNSVYGNMLSAMNIVNNS
ncbi:MAG: hypothetical protein A2X13_05525 [Bacteroidetes bacterium GWC2_33_15]|nr:MAG: hypothetical protein A2X10_00210 [Bacteroidetes bacterium GWA2_33_15]OFX52031.1 MAG: hypothetical protein A2X13_05525 [Bacteroidetes bacterium GWC2_33_15]OFX63861.1 MAG: hypothetical protein A2X15_00450 [Bacteroidetes bacterium GWB2_32_14]OFX67426.1 MAG: hypothetical protein A2X14_12255 [Bacteroidetes bacterium GWD2_33_33]